MFLTKIHQYFKSFKQENSSLANYRNWPNYQHGWLSQFPVQARIEDIYFCFRLILGRNPNKEEWAGHTDRAGEPLTNIVTTYIQSQEFANRQLLKRHAPTNIQLADYVGFSIYAAADDIAVGKHVLAHCYEPEISYFFEKIVKPDMGVIDIGANIGYFSLLSAYLVGQNGWVMAVEPNPDNIKLLQASRQRNGFKQIQLIQAAASIYEDIMVLRTENSNGTCSARLPEEGNLFAADLVACLTLDKIVSKRVHLIKVDVEGGELLALQGCLTIIERDEPVVIFEFSPNRIVDRNGCVAWSDLLLLFLDRGYLLAVIKPHGGLIKCATVTAVYQEFEAVNVDHIDLIAFKGNNLLTN